MKRKKISIYITKEQNDFLADMVESGKAANRSHAARIAIARLKEVTKNE